MTVCFSKYASAMFVSIFKDPKSTRVTRSLIKEFSIFLLDVWNTSMAAEEEDFFLIIDNASTPLPLRRWLVENGVRLKEILLYSPDTNPITHIWALLKYLLHKFYSHLYKLKGEQIVKKELEETIIPCWELLKPHVFHILAESIVDRVQAVIGADAWYTKY